MTVFAKTGTYVGNRLQKLINRCRSGQLGPTELWSDSYLTQLDHSLGRAGRRVDLLTDVRQVTVGIGGGHVNQGLVTVYSRTQLTASATIYQFLKTVYYVVDRLREDCRLRM